MQLIARCWPCFHTATSVRIRLDINRNYRLVHRASNSAPRQESKLMKLNSPEKPAHLVLGIMSVRDIKNFLMDCLNLPDPISRPAHRPHFERWLKRWQRLFTLRSESENGGWESKPIAREQLERFAPKVWSALRRIWYEKDPRQRDWYFYRLRDEYHHMIVRAENPNLIDLTDRNAVNRLLDLERQSHARGGDATQRRRFFETWAVGTHLLEEVPTICPFEAAVYWLQVHQRLMVYCEGPVCPAPYFFRIEKGQKFCSPDCAGPARREAKLRWWNQSPNSPKNRAKKKAVRRTL